MQAKDNLSQYSQNLHENLIQFRQCTFDAVYLYPNTISVKFTFFK